MQDRYNIHALRKEDISGLMDLMSVAFAEDFAVLGMDREKMATQIRRMFFLGGVPAQLMQTLAGICLKFLLAEDSSEEGGKGKIIGSIGLSGQRSLTVIAVSTHPDYRRRGIAKVLLQAILEEAKKLRRDRVTLDVLAHNTPAIKLYESMGFKTFYRYFGYGIYLPFDREAFARRLQAHDAAFVRDLHVHDLEYFSQIERASLPDEYFEVMPSLRSSYAEGFFARTFFSLVGIRSKSIVLTLDKKVIGFFTAEDNRALEAGEIGTPLISDEYLEYLPLALQDCLEFLEKRGKKRAGLRIPAHRAELVSLIENLGFQRVYSFLRMVKWL